ncbi:hypothetical protein FACS189472_09450 [Alphaproteobacteria bacterium]|nr:hypothetical protein FACS189472_09450 [Alphaproteobacteria bacterium]
MEEGREDGEEEEDVEEEGLLGNAEDDEEEGAVYEVFFLFRPLPPFPTEGVGGGEQVSLRGWKTERMTQTVWGSLPLHEPQQLQRRQQGLPLPARPVSLAVPPSTDAHPYFLNEEQWWQKEQR